MSDTDTEEEYFPSIGIAAPDSSDASDPSDEPEDEERQTNEGPRLFDTDLPTTHKYLGKLNNISGYTLFDEGETITMLALHTNTMVFPGFTLPLIMHSQYEGHIMQNYIEKKSNVFILVHADESRANLYEYGVVMEVFETTTKNGVLILKARGRQRCKVCNDRDVAILGGRLRKLTVRILGEPQVTSPIDNTLLYSLKQRRHTCEKNYRSLLKNYKYRRYHLSQYPHNSWVYDRNEVSFYVDAIVKRLSAFYFSDVFPKDPTALSYWVVQNFQLTDEERLAILKLNSTLERLRQELDYLKVQRVMCCGTCKIEIASQKDVFVMSKDGIQSNYCNPGGHVFETVTVLKARNFVLTGEPSREFSWFPGYAWTIMQCKMCKGHLGWQFTSKHLQPPSFYGLAKSGFYIKRIPLEV